MTRPPSPNFLGIGPPRAGTTWLWTVLRQHPQIWMPPRKEIHYFDRDQKYPTARQLQHARLIERLFRFDRGGRKWWRVFATDVYYLLTGAIRPSEISWLARYHFGYIDDTWYLSLFRNRPGLVTGEITPDYCLLDAEDVQRVHALLPQVKLLYNLREPVERSWSQIRFGMGRRGIAVEESALPEMMRRANSLSQQMVGDYVDTIKRWRQFYPDGRMFFVYQEQIEREPEPLARSLFRFLGVDESFQLPSGLLRRKVNASAESDMPAEVRRVLVERNLAMVTELHDMVGGFTAEWLESYKQA